MQAIGILFIHLMYLIFFIGYFIVFYVKFRNLVLPYFLIATFVLVMEFFSLRGDHQTFIVFILLNIFYLTYETLRPTTKNKRILIGLPIIALIPFLLILIISLLNIVTRALPYLIDKTYVQVSLIALMSLLMILSLKKVLNIYTFIGIIILYGFIIFPITIFNMKHHIKTISIEKFGIPPQCININTNIYNEFRHPHALVEKNEKFYYWSFRKNDFIENNRIIDCR